MRSCIRAVGWGRRAQCCSCSHAPTCGQKKKSQDMLFDPLPLLAACGFLLVAVSYFVYRYRTIQTFQIPPALYSESRFLQVCLCPLPSVEEMWYQRSHTSAFLWKLQRAKKDGKVVCCSSCHFVDDYLECAACRIWHIESKRLDSRLFICEQYDT